MTTNTAPITLHTLGDATPQAVFDQVARHLVRQGKKSWANACRYRANNLKCAAGCLISDDEYRETMEGVTWSVLAVDGRVPTAHIQLITDLQVVHDAEYPNHWGAQLRRIAEKYGLDPGVLDNL